MKPTRVNDSAAIGVKNWEFNLEDLIREIQNLPAQMNDTLSEALQDGIDVELAAESCHYPEDLDPLLLKIYLPLGEEQYDDPIWAVSLRDLVTSLLQYWKKCSRDAVLYGDTPPPISRVAEALREQAARLELAQKYQMKD